MIIDDIEMHVRDHSTFALTLAFVVAGGVCPRGEWKGVVWLVGWFL
jgi:hypothetical protein